MTSYVILALLGKPYPVKIYESEGETDEFDEDNGEDASDDTNSEYYILGGGNNSSPNLDLLENLSAIGSGFNYVSSYDELDVSGGLSPLMTARHGAGAEYSDADGSPAIYLIGGYTSAQDDTFVDIDFDI